MNMSDKNRPYFRCLTLSISGFFYNVRMKGLEPPLHKELDPKSSASTNSATPAKISAKLE